MPLSSIAFTTGAVTFVLIGALHTYVHFVWLTGDALFLRMDALGTVPLGHMDAPVWGLFQGTSILMGFFSLAFGAALLTHAADRHGRPQVRAALCGLTILLLVGIMIVGGLHLSALQVYGGAFGIICFGLPLITSLRAMGQPG
ncbi:MAG: hypothetical protein AAGF60_04285 [Pseudomonadota bacterium]